MFNSFNALDPRSSRGPAFALQVETTKDQLIVGLRRFQVLIVLKVL
jgi:hypothetical protein